MTRATGWSRLTLLIAGYTRDDLGWQVISEYG